MLRRRLLLGAVAGALALSGCSRRRPPRVSVSDYGADPSGSRDSTGAIQRAMNERRDGDAVLVGAGTYRLDGTLMLTSSLIAQPGAEFFGGASGQPVLWCDGSAPDGAVVDGLTIRPAGSSAPSALCRVASQRPATLTNCSFLGSGVEAVGVDASDARDLTIRSCRFSGLTTSVLLLGPTLRVRLLANVIEDWSGRGFFVVSNAAGGSVALVLEDNVIRNHRGGPGPEQPISFQAVQDHLHQDVTVTGNAILGPSRSWLEAVKGTADQISLSHIDGLVVSRNTSVWGGDMGITVSDQCRDVLVSDNVCIGNDASGIDVGSVSTRWLENITLRNNFCLNNGRNATGRRQPLDKAGVVIVQGGLRTTIENNVVGNATTLPTYQGYGICVPPGFERELEQNDFGRHLDGDIGYGNGVLQRGGPIRLPGIGEPDRARVTARLDELVRDLRKRSLLPS